ncbi:unnamed protein product [Ceratitis capitata]|uniref:(Mediterranean fruit fly) hypothetical protein n=1 Tax=Ceratitis capitata TaxID=7213 RepID=A0A811UI93_CERCA|nr:unnamed protein product [Ceratitis capitata]
MNGMIVAGDDGGGEEADCESEGDVTEANLSLALYSSLKALQCDLRILFIISLKVGGFGFRCYFPGGYGNNLLKS